MWSRSRSRLLALAAAALMLAGCSAGGSGSSATMSANAVLMSDEDAADEFLSVVCPTDTALHVLGNVGVAAGGWTKVRPSQSKPYAESAIDQARGTAERLLSTTDWPVSVTESIRQVADEYLSIVTPLQLIASAVKGSAMAQPWATVSSKARTAEQRVRLELGLGTAGSEDDGCPPEPRVEAPNPATSPSGSGTDSGTNTAWTSRWQSPSGNLRCGYAPRSSKGVPLVACLDADTNTLARLYNGYRAAISSATSSQRQQLPGGPTMDFNDGISVGPFACALLDQGMTCRDTDTGAGFLIRRGVAYET